MVIRAVSCAKFSELETAVNDILSSIKLGVSDLNVDVQNSVISWTEGTTRKEVDVSDWLGGGAGDTVDIDNGVITVTKQDGTVQSLEVKDIAIQVLTEYIKVATVTPSPVLGTSLGLAVVGDKDRLLGIESFLDIKVGQTVYQIPAYRKVT